MSDNDFTGDTALHLGGTAYRLRFSWTALAALETKFGDRALTELNSPAKLAETIAIGLQEHHPEMTAARILEISPPLRPTLDTVVAALNRAMWGRASGADRPANPPPRPSLLRRLLPRRSAPRSGLATATSGAAPPGKP